MAHTLAHTNVNVTTAGNLFGSWSPVTAYMILHWIATVPTPLYSTHVDKQIIIITSPHFIDYEMWGRNNDDHSPANYPFSHTFLPQFTFRFLPISTPAICTALPHYCFLPSPSEADPSYSPSSFSHIGWTAGHSTCRPHWPVIFQLDPWYRWWLQSNLYLINFMDLCQYVQSDKQRNTPGFVNDRRMPQNTISSNILGTTKI